MTYNEFLENVLRPDKRTKKQLKGRFTHAGEVGEALGPWHNKIQAALQIPPEQRAAAAAALPKLARGQYYILPSFFRLVNHLEVRRGMMQPPMGPTNHVVPFSFL